MHILILIHILEEIWHHDDYSSSSPFISLSSFEKESSSSLSGIGQKNDKILLSSGEGMSNEELNVSINSVSNTIILGDKLLP